jgi:tetratricopeptide (TPR) repeat protein
MRRIWIAGWSALALASAGTAQDAPTRLEPADHAVQMPAAHDAHSHDDNLKPKVPTLLEGYGSGGFAITTAVPQAQAFFANGMELGAAFAHSAAGAAMEHAVALDPQCAMCKWGQALVEGPTINYGKDKAERKPLYALAREAEVMAVRGGTSKERELTAALVERYRPGSPAKRDAAYAKAMLAVQAQFPADNEIAVLTADALMVDSFNAFAKGEDFDRAEVARAAALLEGVLARDPDHTPAIHFYIHAQEALGEPRKAEPYADKLANLAPNASHLVHMPSHTWYWLGRYEEAARTNLRAVEIGKANAARLGLPAPDGVWGLPYHSHNVIYGLGGALMAGDETIGLELARPLVEIAAKREDGGPTMQLMAALGYETVARFDPKSVAALPEPKLPYLKAAWHYARGEAAATAGDAAALRAEMEAIPPTIAKPKKKDSKAPEQMLGVMRAILAGRLAMLGGDPKAAAEHFRAAADLEETPEFNDFTDPPAFWYPVRRDVAAALLAAGDARGAREAAEASLRLRMKDPVAEALLAKANAVLVAVK